MGENGKIGKIEGDWEGDFAEIRGVGTEIRGACAILQFNDLAIQRFSILAIESGFCLFISKSKIVNTSVYSIPTIQRFSKYGS